MKRNNQGEPSAMSPEVLAFTRKLEKEIHEFADAHPHVRFVVLIGDEHTESLGVMGNMSESLGQYALGIYVRHKHARGTA